MDAQAYVDELCSRYGTAAHIPFVKVSAGEWRPQVGRCHENATTWAKMNPGHQAVRGWVTWHPILQGVRLTAHSVVQRPDGSLIDITPLMDETFRRSMLFVRHVGDDDTFFAMVAAHNAFDCYSGGTT